MQKQQKIKFQGWATSSPFRIIPKYAVKQDKCPSNFQIDATDLVFSDESDEEIKLNYVKKEFCISPIKGKNEVFQPENKIEIVHQSPVKQVQVQSILQDVVNLSMNEMNTPVNDSGITIEQTLYIIDTDNSIESEQTDSFVNQSVNTMQHKIETVDPNEQLVETKKMKEARQYNQKETEARESNQKEADARENNQKEADARENNKNTKEINDKEIEVKESNHKEADVRECIQKEIEICESNEKEIEESENNLNELLTITSKAEETEIREINPWEKLKKLKTTETYESNLKGEETYNSDETGTSESTPEETKKFKNNQRYTAARQSNPKETQAEVDFSVQKQQKIKVQGSATSSPFRKISKYAVKRKCRSKFHNDATDLVFSDESHEEIKLNYVKKEFCISPIKGKNEVFQPENKIEIVHQSPVKQVQVQSILQDVVNLSMNEMNTPVNDSGITIEQTLYIIDTDNSIESEQTDSFVNQSVNTMQHKIETVDPNEQLVETNKMKEVKVVDPIKRNYKKPLRPCFFCKIPQSRLKRHILSKHAKLPSVVPLLSMNEKDKDRHIENLRKQAIRNHNVDALRSGEENFLRERKSTEKELTVMCSGCKGFFAKTYKARHQLICPASGANVMMPMVSIKASIQVENYSSSFISLLNTLCLDDVGNYVKSDKIILMIGSRSFDALKRKKDKKTETTKSVRARMRLTARLYLQFCDLYKKQNEVVLTDELNNAADMYRRETIAILGSAINALSENHNEDESRITVTGQKSGLKVSILNLLKLTGKFLIGYFLVLNEDGRSEQVVQFLKVLKLFEDDLFGDAYYDINYRKNVNLKKPINLPLDEDVNMLNDECINIMNSIDILEYPSESYVSIRSATATCLIIFCARRGGEPVRLQLFQWEEALKGEWVDKDDHPGEFNTDTMYITYQTGKGADHLVPVIFPPQSIKAMKYLTNAEVRRNCGIHKNNPYIFASTKNSLSHASGWHSINDILTRLSKKGAINATKNRHRIATMLAKLELSEQERQLIFKHFGHSQRMNENVYQSAPGSLQLKSTGQQLLSIHTSHTSKVVCSSVEDQEICKGSVTEKDISSTSTMNGLSNISKIKTIHTSHRAKKSKVVCSSVEDQESCKGSVTEKDISSPSTMNGLSNISKIKTPVNAKGMVTYIIYNC